MNNSIDSFAYLYFIVLLACFQVLLNILGILEYLFLYFNLIFIMLHVMLDFFIRLVLLWFLQELLFHSFKISIDHALFFHYVLILPIFVFQVKFYFVISFSKPVQMAHVFLYAELQNINFSIKYFKTMFHFLLMTSN